MPLQPAIRLLLSKSPKPTSTILHLLCHVKPGVSAKREGINSVTNDCITVCVSAQAKEGEANKAVREVLAEVLKVPKSDVSIAKGMKSREKTVEVVLDGKTGGEEEVERVRKMLVEGVIV
ncbi:DUF167-domain-containing protein [Sporormia fimetaria CBS 119925]|uniref:DUF167-domain-containing protein n=1 Tax=Sporormia fimetaria CBS 119925 TaxID=1340428 RepID=A0A6A6VB20_9PLEO|nr:DUF167-domain-containing protein [Sporormia fimetaria CBS 119925]